MRNIADKIIMLPTRLVGLAPRRKAAGFTQQSYADALGVDRARVGMYEIGKAWPPAALLPAMAALLGCSIDELYELPVEASDTSSGAPRHLPLKGKAKKKARAPLHGVRAVTVGLSREQDQYITGGSRLSRGGGRDG